MDLNAALFHFMREKKKTQNCTVDLNAALFSRYEKKRNTNS